MLSALGGRGAIDLGLQRVLSVLRELDRPQQALEGRVAPTELQQETPSERSRAPRPDL
jgi:hypothetical protein